jgi:CRISPR system Cascade subunit CasB
MAEFEKHAREAVGEAVEAQIRLIERSRDAEARSILAKLRRGAGKPPGYLPEIWEYTVAALPESSDWGDEARYRAEYAVHAALTLFALHRQGADSRITGLARRADKSGKRRPVSFGAAAGGIAFGDEDRRKAVTRRFNAAVTSGTADELTTHARSLVQMLKGEDVDMDYPKFARDLFEWQRDAEKTRLEWGRDYWRRAKGGAKEENSEGEKQDEE